MADSMHPFRTERLIMRAIESPDDDELFLRIQQTPIDYRNANARALKPQSKADAARVQKHSATDALIGVVMCLAPREDAVDAKEKERYGPAIGTMHLSSLPPHLSHCRFSEVGIDILSEYQGKGYGTEAITWLLEWGFQAQGLHRIEIQAWEYNTGARKLYEKLGFTPEGVQREVKWSHGRFWDSYRYGMLEHEWRALHEKKQTDGGGKQGAISH